MCKPAHAARHQNFSVAYTVHCTAQETCCKMEERAQVYFCLFVVCPGLIGFLFTLLLGTLMSFLASQVVSPSQSDLDPDKATRNLSLEPCLLHPIVACCTPHLLPDNETEEKQYREVM